MSLSDRARSWADWLTGSGVEPHGAALLYECAAELESKDAEIAALRAAVLELPEYGHRDYCDQSCNAGCTNHAPCRCNMLAANDALAAARKLAGLEE